MSAADWSNDAPPGNQGPRLRSLNPCTLVSPALAPALLRETAGDAMSHESKDNKVVVLADRTSPQTTLLPVTRLVSRPSVRIVDGRLAAVLELARSAA